MTVGLYARHLQTALDDTLGPVSGRRQLEMVTPDGVTDEGIIGRVDKRFYLAVISGLAPDLSKMKLTEMHHLWVLAVSVFSKKKVLRVITLLLELLAIWDYAGKIWYKEMADSKLSQLLHSRIQSPPGKMLTSIAFSICQQVMDAILCC